MSQSGGPCVPIHLLRFIPLLPLFAFASLCALAWNGPGHMVIGAIAYNSLRTHNSGTIEKTVHLLERHPYYDSSWRNKIAKFPSENRPLLLFMFAAQWADSVRRNREFSHNAWHYTNIPYIPAGQPWNIRGESPDPENIVWAYAHNRAIVENKDLSERDRAVALTWLFHLVGDVHQPLHTVSLYTTRWPHGDRGGNAFYVRARAENRPIKLHEFWDGLIIGSDRFQSQRNAAILIEKTYPRDALPEMANSAFDAWAQESFQLAQSHVYLFGQLPGSVSEAAIDVPVLSQAYRTDAKELGMRRAAQAGYRLANILTELFG